eukprot:4937376-Amphidinium_carterae.1
MFQIPGKKPKHGNTKNGKRPFLKNIPVLYVFFSLSKRCSCSVLKPNWPHLPAMSSGAVDGLSAGTAGAEKRRYRYREFGDEQEVELAVHCRKTF